MSGYDWGWFQKSFDCLFGFCYLHVLNTAIKVPHERAHDWDFAIDDYDFVVYKNFGSCNLLAGYALETLLKCCLDQIGWRKEFETHNLRFLAQSVADSWNLKLTDQQLEYLDNMTDDPGHLR